MADVVTSSSALAAAPSAAPEDARWRVIARNAFPFIVVFAIWETVAQLGIFPPRLFPSLLTVAQAFVSLTVEGILPHHALDTILRLLAGFALAGLVGVTLGILMGRSRRFEDIVLPLVSVLAPIPGIAWAPLFLLWFGLGSQPAMLLVAFVSAFPIIFNTWTGVKAVKEIWVRSAQAMGADDRRLFVKVSCRGRCPTS
jgi:ABC-type nitrate/sulfonate/bicarbonate transport system permease component